MTQNKPHPPADLLEILVCPICKGKLEYDREGRRLLCKAEKIAFPVADDGAPVLLAEEASRPPPADE